MKLSTILLISGTAVSSPILTDLVTLNNSTFIYWGLLSTSLILFLGGIFLWGTGDNKEV